MNDQNNTSIETPLIILDSKGVAETIDNSQFVTIERLCNYLKISRTTLTRKVKAGIIPEPIRLGKAKNARTLYSVNSLRQLGFVIDF